MLQIKDTLVSLDLIEQSFCCDLDRCKGACCVEGEGGAPVELDEVLRLEDALTEVWNDLSPEAKSVIRKQGVVYSDHDGDLLTSIVNGKDCVFTCYDETGTCFCAIEKAWREGRTTFMKPVSCHLYPVRVKKYPDFQAVNYQEWSICASARECGRNLGLPVYKFLKVPLIRKFGEDWYEELSLAAEMLSKQK